MGSESDDGRARSVIGNESRLDPTALGGATQDIPALLSELYERAPEALRVKLLEHLLRPVGPLAMVAIAAGAFGRFIYRLRRDAVPIALEDAARITSVHVLHLARYVEQSSPHVLRQVASLLANQPVGLATISTSAVLVALSLWTRSHQKRRTDRRT